MLPVNRNHYLNGSSCWFPFINQSRIKKLRFEDTWICRLTCTVSRGFYAIFFKIKIKTRLASCYILIIIIYQILFRIYLSSHIFYSYQLITGKFNRATAYNYFLTPINRSILHLKFSPTRMEAILNYADIVRVFH